MTTYLFRNPRVLLLVIAVIAVAGLGALEMLPRREDPRLTTRWATVLTALPGADAERVDALVTDPLEDALLELDEIRALDSTSRTGLSVIQIELDDAYGRDDVDAIWSRVRDSLEDARPTLPPDAGRPEFRDDEIDAVTLIAGVTWHGAEPANDAVLTRLAEQLEDDLRAVPGTEHTSIRGLAPEEIVVELDPDALRGYGITAASIAERIRASDAKVSAGQLRAATANVLLEVTGEVDSLARIEAIPVVIDADGAVVPLSALATVRKGVREPRAERVLINGAPGVAVSAQMAEAYRIDQWSARARAVVEQFGATLARDVSVTVIFDQSGYTEVRLGSLMRNFLLGIGAVMIVVMLMMGWRSALIVGTALPLSALMVLAGMRAFGIPIHQMSITGLIIALGLLIDNAIVIVDEFGRRVRDGRTPVQAIASSVRHLAIPLAGSTATTVLAFMPILIMPGGAGEFVGSIAGGVIIALLSSLLLALTVVPTLAARLHAWRPATHAAHGLSIPPLARVYERVVGFALRHPIVAVIAALALPAVGFMQSGTLVEQFFPPADRDQFQLQIRLPETATIDETERIARAIDALLAEDDAIVSTHWYLGRSAPLYYYNMMTGEDGRPNYGAALVQMASAEDGSATINRVQERVQRAHPDVRVLALQLEQGPPFIAPIELKIFGPDPATLAALGEQYRDVLATVPDIVTTRSSLTLDRPKLSVALDEDAAQRAGLDAVAIAQQLDAALEGAVGGSFLESSEELPIRVRLGGAQRASMDDVASIDLRGAHATVPLTALADIELVPELASIDREEGNRVNRVLGYVRAGVLPGGVLDAYRARLASAAIELPPGYSIQWGGETSERARAVGNLMASVAVLMVLMITTLVLTFHSFRVTALIGVVAAGSVGLALGALWVFDQPFGFMAIVGTMGLIGVAINDSIVVLAAIREDPAATAGDLVALQRVVMRATRHVLSTTLTTIAGFTPLLIAGGGFWPPLAIAIAGGVSGATVLALILVPSAYRALACPRRAPADVSAPEPRVALT